MQRTAWILVALAGCASPPPYRGAPGVVLTEPPLPHCRGSATHRPDGLIELEAPEVHPGCDPALVEAPAARGTPVDLPEQAFPRSPRPERRPPSRWTPYQARASWRPRSMAPSTDRATMVATVEVPLVATRLVVQRRLMYEPPPAGVE